MATLPTCQKLIHFCVVRWYLYLPLSLLSKISLDCLFLRIGCILLSIGQDEFHREAMNTLHYVVNQSDYTVQTLTNVTEYLTLAKTINVAQLFLPPNVNDDIDKLNVDLDKAANELKEKTSENSAKIEKVFNAVYEFMTLVVLSNIAFSSCTQSLWANFLFLTAGAQLWSLWQL